MSASKRSPSVLSGPPQRVSVAVDSPKENSAPRRRSPPKQQLHATTPTGVRREKLTGVKKAQMEALQAFGGKSLGNVLDDAPKPVVAPAPTAPQTLLSKARERRQQEAMAQFGGDLDALTNEAKDKMMQASMKHLQEKEQSQQAIIRSKVNLKKQNTWDKDLSEVDFKPGLSRVERERMEYLEAKRARQIANGAVVAAAEEEAKQSREREDHARKVREAERAARDEARRQAEAEKNQRIDQARAGRKVAKMAPFMQQTAEAKKSAQVETQSVAEQTIPEVVVQEPIVPEPRENVESTAVAAAEIPSLSASPIESSSSPAQDSPVASPEQPLEPLASPAAVEDVKDCISPERVFRTAVSSLCNSPALDESMGELLDQISIDNLSAELTPNCSMSAKSEEEVLEIANSLQKRKTPIIRQPFYDAPQVNEQLRGALEELAQQIDNREAALLVSMRDSLSGWTVKELKEELKSHDLKVSGLKSELIDRLIEFRKQNKTAESDKCAIM